MIFSIPNEVWGGFLGRFTLAYGFLRDFTYGNGLNKQQESETTQEVPFSEESSNSQGNLASCL